MAKKRAGGNRSRRMPHQNLREFGKAEEERVHRILTSGRFIKRYPPWLERIEKSTPHLDRHGGVDEIFHLRGDIRIYVDITISHNVARYKNGGFIICLLVQKYETDEEIFEHAIGLVGEARTKIGARHQTTRTAATPEIRQAAE
jgi:hypothetical protein